jgi:hypothetical protein
LSGQPRPRSLLLALALPRPALARGLAARGLREGWPPALTAENRAADRAAYRRCRCATCNGRLAVRPFHGSGRYVLLLACGACGRGEL